MCGNWTMTQKEKNLNKKNLKNENLRNEALEKVPNNGSSKEDR